MVSYRSTNTLRVCSSSFLRIIRCRLDRISSPLKGVGIQTFIHAYLNKKMLSRYIIERGIVGTSIVDGDISRSQGTVRILS